MYSCKICPFECGVDRNLHLGVCGLPRKILVSHYQQHFFEEPMISGCPCSDCAGGRGGGSGTVFFTGCNGRCVFCQNYKISQKENWGKKILNNGKFSGEVDEEGLFKICRELIDAGAHNINFVSPTPYSELLLGFLKKYKKGLGVPVVWNSNGYEKASTIGKLKGLVDVYLPDLKYFNDELAVEYSKMPSYFKFASGAVLEMVDQVGWPVIGENGFIQSGVIVRHLVLPGQINDSKKVLEWIFSKFGSKAFVALMAQYYPTYKACDYPEIDRRLTVDEYDEISSYFSDLGFEDGLVQELSSASEIYTPEF
jgi:putative pyruvate formate lyase activating enzyme